MGRVYRALHIKLNRVVAIKMLSPHLCTNQEYVDRFVKEAIAVARLNHPHIVQIYDYGQIDHFQYLAMEFVEGFTLGYYVKNFGAFSQAEIVKLMRQACLALGHSHENGVVHRDVKPDNFILNDFGFLKLADLGLAKLQFEGANPDSDMTKGMTLGTPYYMSPEQIRGDEVDHTADIYSLGATFYHCLTGFVPFPGKTCAVVMARHLTEDVPEPRIHNPNLNETLCGIIQRMMAKNAKDRFSSMLEVGRALSDASLNWEDQEDIAAPVQPPIKMRMDGETRSEVFPELYLGAQIHGLVIADFDSRVAHSQFRDGIHERLPRELAQASVQAMNKEWSANPNCMELMMTFDQKPMVIRLVSSQHLIAILCEGPVQRENINRLTHLMSNAITSSTVGEDLKKEARNYLAHYIQSSEDPDEALKTKVLSPLHTRVPQTVKVQVLFFYEINRVLRGLVGSESGPYIQRALNEVEAKSSDFPLMKLVPFLTLLEKYLYNEKHKSLFRYEADLLKNHYLETSISDSARSIAPEKMVSVLFLTEVNRILRKVMGASSQDLFTKVVEEMELKKNRLPLSKKGVFLDRIEAKLDKAKQKAFRQDCAYISENL